MAALCDVGKNKAVSWAQRLGIDRKNIIYTDKEMAKRAGLDIFDIMVPTPYFMGVYFLLCVWEGSEKFCITSL